MDMKERKLTVIGSVDAVTVVSKLRKYWHTDIVSVGPAKEPEKKEEPKKEGAEKKASEEPKKEEVKKKEDEGKKEEPKKPPLPMPMPHPYWPMPPPGHGPDPRVMAYRAYNPNMTNYYYAQSMEENPNACVIC